MYEGQDVAVGERSWQTTEKIVFVGGLEDSVCICVSVCERKRNAKQEVEMKVGVLKSLETEDKKHELAVVKAGGTERGMSVMVRAQSRQGI